MSVKKSEVSNYDYIEAATRAMEYVFSKNKEIGNDFELISLFDKNGKDYFDANYSGKLSEVPDCLFGLLTACFLEKDIDYPENWWYFLTSKLFANAAQHNNVFVAESVEKKYSKEVNEFKRREEDLIKLDKLGELDDYLKSVKKKNKKNSPPKDDLDDDKK